MSQYYVKQANNWYIEDDSPPVGRKTLTLVQDPDTVKDLKAGTIPYRSESVDRSLGFTDVGSGETKSQQSPYFQQGTNRSLNTGGIEPSASTSLNGGGQDFWSMVKKSAFDTMNRLQNSSLPALQARQSQLEVQKLTAPSSDYSGMDPSGILRSAGARGSEYDPAIQETVKAINQEKGSMNDQMQGLSYMLNIAKTLSPEAEKSANIIEYEYAKKQGFTGSFASWKKSNDSTGGLTTAQIQSTLNNITGQFDNEAVVKQYNVIAEGYQFSKLVAEKKNPTSADDQGLIYAFAKAMDPNSVVRESEYDTVQKYSQSLIQKGWINAKRMLSNQPFLTVEGRKNMLTTINSKYKASEKQYKNIYSEYNRRIDDVKAGKISGSITDYSKANENIQGGSSNIGTIRVKLNSTGQTGTIPKNEFDPSLYTKI